MNTIEQLSETKKLISEAKNVCLIPLEHEPESLTSALALFYTLRELGKNVNLVVDHVPENLTFLLPSVDFISSPKNFVISIPRAAADVSQIYYEKTDEHLKIHLTTDKGQLKKENIAFYFQEAKPDVVITLGVSDFRKHLEKKLDSFGFLLGSPIINIDANPHNLTFGTVNLLESPSITQAVTDLIEAQGATLSKSAANCLLAGLMIHYRNFTAKETTADIFLKASELVQRGADNQDIVRNLAKTDEAEMNFLSQVFKNLTTTPDLLYAMLDVSDFENFSQPQVYSLVEKLKTVGVNNNLMVLWKSHASTPNIKGFFYSPHAPLVGKVASVYQTPHQSDWVFLQIDGEDFNATKDHVLSLMHHG